MLIDKWVYTTDELINFCTDYRYRDYTIFIKSRLVERHDHKFVCGTRLFSNNEYDQMIKFVCIYRDKKFLLTELDVDKNHIVFNLIGDSNDPN